MAAQDSALREAPAAPSLEVPADRLLHDWREAHERVLAYLKALGLAETQHERLGRLAIERALAQPWQDGGDAVSETLRALWELLPAEYPGPPRPCAEPIDVFLGWRLDAYLSARFVGDDTGAGTPIPPRHEGRFTAIPRLARRPMVPEQIERRALRRLVQRLRGIRLGSRAAMKYAPLLRLRRNLPWTGAARRRRLLLAVLVLIPSTIASGFMINVLPHQGGTWLEFFIVIFFGALFGWISIGFWTALLGFLALIGKRSRFAITNLATLDEGGFRPAGRTAVVMPICEEPVDRVFAGLKTIFQSLERAGALENFDFFILSDSSNPGTCIKEEEAWAEWCRSIGRFDKVFYRRRRVHQKRKSGNVADFCRRWGAQYGYMIMLDADSIMAGDTLVRLVQMMERSPGVGMIQTAPSAVNRRSLFARVQQFASRVYGPMFAAGLHYWQLGDGQYWGHNAIIRVAAFMAHCGLRRLPGKPPLGGDIMSHDFVEAALMGRAGWSLWLAYDLSGSYEEVPSTLLEEMGRDRRWCQGNLQHLRLLFSEGLFGAHRALFVNGVLSYVSALLWFSFLTLSTAEAIQNALHLPDYFPHGRSLFPDWPIWRPDWALYLAAVTAMILFLPKFLSIVLIALKGREARAYGGLFRLFLSVLIEIVLSSLLAPIRMVFHSRFVVQNLLGRTVSWHSQGREDAETSWGEAIRRHGFDTVFASGWGISLYLLNPYYFWWVTPIIGALILSIPSSVLASRVSLGDRARRRGLFLIPEESEPPRELRDLQELLRLEERREEALPEAEQDGFVRAAVDPYVNALHRVLLGRRRSLRPSIRAARCALLQRALADGPRALDTRARQVLLGDPELVDELHQRVWRLAERHRAALWGRPGSSG